MLRSLRSLLSTGFSELTKDALEATVEQYERFSEAQIEPEPDAPPGSATAGKKKRRASRGKKKRKPSAS